MLCPAVRAACEGAGTQVLASRYNSSSFNMFGWSRIFKQPDARLIKESPQAFDNDNTFNEFNYNSPQMQSPQNYLRKSYENPFSDFHSCNQQSANFPSYQQRYASPTQMVP